MNKRKVYLDHSATTPLAPEVLAAMMPYYKELFGNASSMHGFGQEARKAIEDARERVMELIHAANPEEIVFTSSGTEADNLAVKGIALANRKNGNHIITSQVEHHAILYTCAYLETQGFEVTYLPVDRSGRVDPDAVQKALRQTTILVSIMHANNEVGVIQPIAEIGHLLDAENAKRFARGAGQICFHSDAVQTAGKIAVDVQELGVDLLSFSAHKFYGPKGAGALYIRCGTAIQPILHGGHHERNLRAGTENVAGIVGLAKALELAVAHREKEQRHLTKLRDRLEDGIARSIPRVGFNGQGASRLAGISNSSFEFIEGESLLLSLDLEGIAASAGSACASGSSEPSHVLKAMCVDPVMAQGTLRFSLGHENTDDDIDYVLKVLPKIVTRLRDMSPLWREYKNKSNG
jgi:cysteine desulfurase